jgi:nucleotide-binding universal stress UspA family protein
MTEETIKRILVVSRMRTFSRGAIRFGVSLARKYDADLVILHAMHNPFSMGWSLPMIFMEDEYKKELAEEKKKLDAILWEEKARGLRVTEYVKYGEPIDEVAKIVNEEKIDIVIATAHKSRLERIVYGYSYEEVIRKIHCSILLVRGPDVQSV